MELCCLVAVLPQATDCPLCGVGLTLQRLASCGHCGMWKGPPLVPCAGDLRGNDVVPPTLTLEAPELEFLPPAPIRSRGRLGGGEPGRCQYQPSTRVVIFPVMFVGVQLKFVFLAERQEGQFGTHTTHVIGGGSPSAWHWLPDS